VPIYEYVCERCDNHFELLLNSSDVPSCPNCGSTELEKQFSVFAVRDAESSRSELPEACRKCGSAGGSCGMG